MEAVHYNPQPVLAAIYTHLQRHQRYGEGCADSVELLSDVATVFGAGDGDPEKVEQLRQAAARLMEARHRSQLQAAALEELKGSYEAGPEPTDFGASLAQSVQRLGEQQLFSAEADPLMRDFEAAAAGGGKGGGGGDDEQIDDDIAIEGGAHQLAPNVICPLSAKPLLQIEDPVQDAQGVVFERSFVENFFRSLPPSKNGRAKLVAGSGHESTLAEMVPAERVIRERRRQARRQMLPGGGQGAGAADADVLDV